jgi:uncharacterized protein (DUF362 family)
MKTHVYLGSLLEKNYLENIQAGFDFIHLPELFEPGAKVFIKPNLTFPEYRPGVMTNPQAIEAAVAALREYTPNIFIGDSDSGGYNRFSMDEVYRNIGILSLVEKYGVTIVNLSKMERRPIQFSAGRQNFSLPLPVFLMDEIDLFITMPVPKIHANTGLSLSFKNQWGCIPENTDRLHLHPYFKQAILAVNRAVKARVAIVDGKFGLNQNGPMKGVPVPLDWLMVSDHIGAAARTACDLLQVPVEKVPHLEFARQNGWIPAPAEITLNQEIQPFTREKFYLKRKFMDLPGLLAFKSPLIAYLAYFSPLAGFLHKVMYLVREPFYDYKKYRDHLKE